MGKFKIYLFMFPLSLFLIAVIFTAIPVVGFVFFPIAYFNVTGFLLLIAIIAFMIDCVIGNVPRFLILLPLAFFGWYYFLVFEENKKVATLEENLKNSNPKGVVKFDRLSHDLVAGNAEALVTKYKIPTTYKRLTSKTKFWSFRMTHNRPCKRVQNYRQRGIHTKGVRAADKDGRRVYFKNLCVYQYPQIPQGSIIELSRKQSEKEDGISISSFNLNVDGELSHTYKTAFTERYRVYPLFKFICFLNSGAQKWQCDWGFVKDSYKLDTSPVLLAADEIEDPMAIMLNLPRYSPSDLINFTGYHQNERSLQQKLDQ